MFVWEGKRGCPRYCGGDNWQTMHMLKTPFSYRFIFQDVFPQFQAGALGNLEAFTSFNGPDFYGLRLSWERVPGKLPQLMNTVQGRLCLCLLAAPLNGFHLMMSLKNKRYALLDAALEEINMWSFSSSFSLFC